MDDIKKEFIREINEVYGIEVIEEKIDLIKALDSNYKWVIENNFSMLNYWSLEYNALSETIENKKIVTSKDENLLQELGDKVLDLYLYNKDVMQKYNGYLGLPSSVDLTMEMLDVVHEYSLKYVRAHVNIKERYEKLKP